MILSAIDILTAAEILEKPPAYPSGYRWIGETESRLHFLAASISVTPANGRDSECDLLVSMLHDLGLAASVDDQNADIQCVLIENYYKIAERLDDLSVMLLPAKFESSRVIIGPLFNPEWPPSRDALMRMATVESVLRYDWHAVPMIDRVFGLSRFAAELAKIVLGGSDALDATTCKVWKYVGVKQSTHRILGVEHESTILSELRLSISSDASADLTSKELTDVVDPITGIVQFVHTIKDTPVFVCATLHDGGGHQANRLASAGRRFGSGGKGTTADEAIRSCIGEAVERFCCTYATDRSAVWASQSDLERRGDRFLDPRKVLCFSDAQYKERSNGYDAPNRIVSSGFNWVPPRYDPDADIEWRLGISYPSFAATLIPAALIYFDCPTAGAIPFCKADSNGCAAGVTIPDAASHAILELVERDACAIWWYNRIKREGFDLSASADPFVSRVVSYNRRIGRHVDVIDITSDIDIPVCAAVSSNESGRDIHIGLGASTSIAGAARRALAEMEQVATIELGTLDSSSDDQMERELHDWYATAMINDHSYLIPTSRRPIEWEGTGWPNREVPFERIAGAIKRTGLEIYLVNMGKRDLPISVVRAMVPGLCHFWRRTGCRRLYDVPVEMGWVNQPRSEVDLNPTSFFL
jgi:thiazole/oxazole-forming peptide maturase SagD family component